MLNFKNITMIHIGLALLLIGCSLFFYFPMWIYFVLIGSWFLFIMIGSFAIRLNFFLKATSGNSQVTKKVVALTFDDGPNPMYTPEVLDLLERYDAKATFFCIGKEAEAYPKLVSQIVEKGHEIGNHSHSHKKNISFNGTKCWLREIENTDARIENIIGKKPTLFRPPYGVTTPHLAKAIGLSNHNVVGWTIRPFDTTLKNVHTITKYISKKIRPGAIILLHDTHHRIPLILEHTLMDLKARGYQAVSLTDLMHEK